MSSLNQSTYTTLDPWHLPWERIKPKRTIKQRQPKALPLATLFHVGCQAMAYYFVAYRQRGVRASSEILIWCGAKDAVSIAAGDWYRYITPYFVPCHLGHAILTIAMEIYVGGFLEPEWGSARIFIIIWTSVAAGIRGSCSVGGGNPSTGYTAAIMGLLSAYFVDLMKGWQDHDRWLWRRFFLFWMLMTIMQWSLTSLDFNDPNLAGFGCLYGFLLGVAFVPMDNPTISIIAVKVAALATAGVVFITTEDGEC